MLGIDCQESLDELVLMAWPKPGWLSGMHHILESIVPDFHVMWFLLLFPPSGTNWWRCIRQPNRLARVRPWWPRFSFSLVTTHSPRGRHSKSWRPMDNLYRYWSLTKLTFTKNFQKTLWWIVLFFTALQYTMNAKLSPHRFWPCHETGSSRRFKWWPTTYTWVSSWLPFTVD